MRPSCRQYSIGISFGISGRARGRYPVGIRLCFVVWGLCFTVWASSPSSSSEGGSVAPSSAYQQLSEAKSAIESKGVLWFKMKTTIYDGTTGRATNVLETTCLRNLPYYNLTTRVISNSVNGVPSQFTAVYDGQCIYTYAQGQHEAYRMDVSKLDAGQRDRILKAQMPPVLPDLPSDAGFTRDETKDRQLCHVITADKLVNECHSFKKFTLWINAETHLPYRLEAELNSDIFSQHPTASGAKASSRSFVGAVEYSDWRMDPIAPPSRFKFLAPDGVRVVDKQPPQENDETCVNCPKNKLKEIEAQIVTTLRSKTVQEAPTRIGE